MSTRTGGGFRRRREAEDPNNTWNMQLFAALLSKNFDEATTLLEKGANVNHSTANTIQSATGGNNLDATVASLGGASSPGSIGGGGAGGQQQQLQPPLGGAQSGGGGDKQSAQALLQQQERQKMIQAFIKTGGAVPLCCAIIFRASGVAAYGEASPGAPAVISIADATEALTWLAHNNGNLNALVDNMGGTRPVSGSMFHLCVHFDWSDTLEKLLRLRLQLLASAITDDGSGNGGEEQQASAATTTTAHLDAGQRDGSGCSPTMLAINQRKLDLAKILIRNLAPFDFGSRVDHDHTPLGRACITGDVNTAELLLQLGDDADQLDPESGRTLLQLAWSAFDRQDIDPALAPPVNFALSAIGGAGGKSSTLTSPTGGAPSGSGSKADKDAPPQMQLLPVLLNRGLDPNKPAANGKLAMTYAMDHLPRHLALSHLDNFLTVSGGDVDGQDATTGRTMLMAAIDNCDIELMRKLVQDYKADVNIVDVFGATALHRACANGRRIGLVEQLLAFEAIQINATDVDGQTPLHRAAIRGREPVVKLLIGKEACDVNASDNNGNTALHYAVREGHANIVDLLVGLNTNPRPVSADGKKKGGASSSHGGAASSGNKRHQSVVDANPLRLNIDAENIDSLTALELAVRVPGRLDHIVPKLLHGNASVHRVAAKSKLNLLQQAVIAGSLETVQSFLSKGADVHHRCALDKTALHYAVEQQEIDIVRELLDNRAVVDAQDSIHMRAPLHIACSNLDADMVKLLLSEGYKANPHVVDENFQTPLHVCCDCAGGSALTTTAAAARPGGKSIAASMPRDVTLEAATNIGKALLFISSSDETHNNNNNGARPAPKDKMQRTPLHYAAAADAVDLVVLLTTNFQDVPFWCVDENGSTPLHLAAVNGAVRVCELFCGMIKTWHENNHADKTTTIRRPTTSQSIAQSLLETLQKDKKKIEEGESHAVKAGASNVRPTDPLVAMSRAEIDLDLEGAASTAARNMLEAEEVNNEVAGWKNGLRMKDSMGRTPMLLAAQSGCAQIGKLLTATQRALRC